MLHGSITTRTSLNNHKNVNSLGIVSKLLTAKLNQHVSAESVEHPTQSNIIYIKLKSNDKYYSICLSNKRVINDNMFNRKCDYNMVISDLQLNINQVTNNILTQVWRKFRGNK